MLNHSNHQLLLIYLVKGSGILPYHSRSITRKVVTCFHPLKVCTRHTGLCKLWKLELGRAWPNWSRRCEL